MESAIAALSQQLGITLPECPAKDGPEPDDDCTGLPANSPRWKPPDTPSVVQDDDYLRRNGIDPDGDMLTQYFSDSELQSLLQTETDINAQFSRKTSIINKTGLAFLAIATALQTANALLFPLVADKLGYGSSFNPDGRLDHNDPGIKAAQKCQ